MKYSLSETKERQSQREHRRNLRTVHHHIALFPGTCCMCGREFQFETGYRVFVDYCIATLVYDICNGCASSRDDACRKFYESGNDAN